MRRSTDTHAVSCPTRREFVGVLAMLAAVPPLGGAAPRKHPAAKPGPLEKAADALAQAVHARTGKHLTEEQLKQVREDIHRGLRAAEALRSIKLTNGDEPDFTFRAEVP